MLSDDNPGRRFLVAFFFDEDGNLAALFDCGNIECVGLLSDLDAFAQRYALFFAVDLFYGYDIIANFRNLSDDSTWKNRVICYQIKRIYSFGDFPYCCLATFCLALFEASIVADASRYTHKQRCCHERFGIVSFFGLTMVGGR